MINTVYQMEIPYISALKEERGGFDFRNLRRNNVLLKGNDGLKVQGFPAVRKTGTTICGIVTKDGVVLGADTRATEGPIVADKKCQKLHRLSNNIWAAGAGTAADLDHTTAMMESKIELLRLSTGRTPRVSAAVSRLQQLLFRYRGAISCALVLGGVDCMGPHLYKIHPHGSTDRLPFCAMGSGSLNALAVLEATYHQNMTMEEGQELVSKAIQAGIYNDLGSGGNVDILTIDRTMKASYIQGYNRANEATQLFRHLNSVVFPSGTTEILKTEVSKLWNSNVVVEDVDMPTVEVLA